MTKRRRCSQFDASGDVAQPMAEWSTVESQDDEESDMIMDVIPIQEHPRTKVQLGLPSDPSTSQVGSHASVKKSLSYFHLFLSYPQNKRNKM